MWTHLRVGFVRSRAHCLTLLLTLASLFWSSGAQAYAWLIRHGYADCSACHTDPSGGEGLTEMGRVNSQTLLTQRWASIPELTDSTRPAYGLDEPDWMRLGGSARAMSILSLPDTLQAAALRAFPMQLDVYSTFEWGRLRAGLSLGYAQVPELSPHLRAAQVFQAASGPNLLSRWHWLGWALADRWLLRAGRLNLPFGLRISEHVAWARELTRTDRESDQQHGLALSHTGPRWRFEAMAVAGNFQVQPDSVRERGYVGFVEYRAAPNLALGLSSEVLHSKQSILAGRAEPTTRQAHGAMLRWAPWRPLVVMAEADLLASSGRGVGHVDMLTLDFEPVQGLHLAVSEEIADLGAAEDGPVSVGAGKPTTGTWLSLHWFFLTHWDLQVDFVTRHAVTPTLQAQLHFYL